MENLLKNEYGKGIAIALVIILLFTMGNFVGSLTSVNRTEEADATTVATTASTTVATTAPTTVATTAPTTEATTAPSEEATTASGEATSDTTTAAPASSAPTTPAEIVAYYNEAANKIKTNATQIVRNYEDMRHDADKLVVPSALQSTGEKLIGTFLKKNETPETWTGADITAKFPVNGESYVSKLTEADVASATCNDTGSAYEITIVAKTEQNPSVGAGVGGAFEIIKNDDVMDAAGFIVKAFNTEYYNCTIKCTVDKATGNITHANFTTPIVMNVDTKIGISATVGMTFEKDYTITY